MSYQEQAIQRAKKANGTNMRINEVRVVDIYITEAKETFFVKIEKVRGSKPGTYKLNVSCK